MKLDLNKAQLNLIEMYCNNEMSELKKICDPIIFKKGIPKTDVNYDELCSKAMDTLIDSVLRYDCRRGEFRAFLVGNIKKTFYDFTRDMRRAKRCNLLKDRNGRIIRDENNKPIVISDISFDAPIWEDADITYGDKIESKYDVWDMLSDKIGLLREERIEKYLNKLSKKQKKIVLLLSEGYKQDEILAILHISKREYSNNMLSIRAYENVRILM